MKTAWPLAVTLLVLTGCGRGPTAGPASAPAPPAAPQPLPAVAPPEPGTAGGLPDDRTPVSEASFSEESAQGAANVVQTYFADLGARNYIGAWGRWADGGRASGAATPDAFKATFAKYAQYDAQIGAPGRIEGAAGSLYVTVPVVIYGRLKTGEEVHEKGEATLRRVNGVPGATPDQRRWHIERIDVKPPPT
jgi:hypothetical protein